MARFAVPTPVGLLLFLCNDALEFFKLSWVHIPRYIKPAAMGKFVLMDYWSIGRLKGDFQEWFDTIQLFRKRAISLVLLPAFCGMLMLRPRVCGAAALVLRERLALPPFSLSHAQRRRWCLPSGSFVSSVGRPNY